MRATMICQNIIAVQGQGDVATNIQHEGQDDPLQVTSYLP